jgi:deoxyribose-phosphate aldolase
MDAATARLAISLVDLTNLADDCNPDDVTVLCERARRHATAAVCIWPDFVAQAAAELAGTGVKVATVVNFPSGSERPYAVGVITERALADGADEIDVVLPFRAFAAGDLRRAEAMLRHTRSITDGRSVIKVILESGELGDLETVRRAARLAIECGADFVKTSTGKTDVSATPGAVRAILEEIRSAGRPVGVKPSGGIRTLVDARTYLALADDVMGPGWATPATFRFGASGLLDVLVGVIEGRTAAGVDVSGERTGY